MDEEKIPFNYFFKLFEEEKRKILFDNIKDKFLGYRNVNELYDIFSINGFFISKEEKLKIYNKSLWNVCLNYLSLSNSKITVLPHDILELINNILDEIEKNQYKESFLTSLQFIYQQYFESLELGCPILMSSYDEECPAYFEITLDSKYKMVTFDSFNMNLLEQTKTMTKVLTMVSNNKQGPISKVGYCIRKDI